MRTCLFVGFSLVFGLSILAGCASESEVEQTPSEDVGQLDPPGEFPRTDDPTLEQPEASDAFPSLFGEQAATGNLADVDLEMMTLVLADSGGSERQFRFDASTEVIGAAGAQALLGVQGSRITVRYEDSDEAVPLVSVIEVEADRDDPASQPTDTPGQQ